MAESHPQVSAMVPGPTGEYIRRGLTAAISRLTEARDRQEQAAWFVAASEAVFWLMLNDELRWGDAYERWRDAQPAGVCVVGLRYLWNLIKHHPIVELVEFTGGVAWPIEWPAVWFDATWPNRGQLPAPDPTRASSRRAQALVAAYDNAVAGQRVRSTLVEAATFFIEPP